MDKTTGQFDIITHHVIDKIPRYFKKLTCYLNMIVIYRFKKITLMYRVEKLILYMDKIT